MNRWLWALACSLILHASLFLLPSPPIAVPELPGNIRVQLLPDSGAKMAGTKKSIKSAREGRQTAEETGKKSSPQTEEKISEPQAKSTEIAEKAVKKTESEVKTSEITPVKTKAEVSEQKKVIKKKALKKKIVKKKLIKKTPAKTVKKAKKAKKKTVKKKVTTSPQSNKSNTINKNTYKQETGQKTEMTGATEKSPGKSSGKTASSKKGNGSGDKIISGEKVQIISRVKPSYPLISRKRKEEGTVTVLLRVKSGRVKSLKIETSSGHDRLDRSAIKALKRWKFDRSVTATVRIPVIFSLKK